MKKLCTILLSAILLLQLCACGASAGTSVPKENISSNSVMGFDQGAPMEPESSPEMPAPDVQDINPPDSLPENAKLIYRGSLSLETTDFDKAVSGIEALTKQCGGYFEKSSLTNDVYRYVYYVIRVPSSNYQSFFDQVGNYAQINDQNHSVENISEQYYDTELRLQTQKTKLDRLQELLENADNMSDIITLESAISDTTMQIELLTGSLRKYDSLVDFATIEINLCEVSALSHQQEPVVGFGAQLVQAFRVGTARFGDDVRWFILDFARHWASYLMNLAILVLIVFVVIRVIKKRRMHKSSSPKAAKPASQQTPEQKK